jgi:exopolysaccharide production protein ExoZ
MKDTVWSLQSLRFVAAAMVVWFHAAYATGFAGTLGSFNVVGQAGVDIFFVLSGVVIARTSPGLSWREFARRRLRRIAPLYFLVSLLMLSAAPAPGWRNLLADLFLWPATDQLTWPLLPSAWTLCFETLFYVSVAFILANRRTSAVFAAVFTASMALRDSGAVFHFLGHPLILEFLFGVAIAFLPHMRRAVWCLPLGAVALAASPFLGFPHAVDGDRMTSDMMFERVLMYGVPAALIVLGTMQIAAKPSIWTFLGDASYSIYLTNQLVISVIPAPSADWFIALALASSVLFGAAVFVYVETPLLKRLGRGRPHPQAASEAEDPPRVDANREQPESTAWRESTRLTWGETPETRRPLPRPHDANDADHASFRREPSETTFAQ